MHDLLLNHKQLIGVCSQPDEQYLNLVLEFIPETVYKICRTHAKQKQVLAIPLVKVYSYQLLRSLAYIHALGICHRDIKPQVLHFFHRL